MSTPIPEVEDTNYLTHFLLLQIELGNTIYYISNHNATITVGGTPYLPMGWLLQVGNVVDDLKTNNGDMTISLTGLISGLIGTVLNAPIKGGRIAIGRAYGRSETGPFYVAQRYLGVITNFAIEETEDIINRDRTYTVAITCANINTLLENRVSGQRTNGSDRKKFYPGDISFDRTKDLQNVNFDFGKKYTGGTGYGGSYSPSGGYDWGGGGGGRGGDFGNFNMQER
jgi:hypothetical protein